MAHVVLWAQRYEMCADSVFEDYVGRVSQRPPFEAAFADKNRFTTDVPQESPAIGLFTG